MPNPSKSRRTASNLLLAGGLVVLLGVAGYFGWTQFQAAALRTQLKQTTAEPTAVAALAPTNTTAPATVTPTAAVAATAVATAVATASPMAMLSPTAAVAATVDQPAVSQPPATALTPASALTAAAPVRLVIPDLKIDAGVVPMSWKVVQTADGPRSEWVVPDNEAGHHVDSVLLGQQGNLVISGHNNIYGKVFRPISFAWDDDQRIKVDDFTDRSDILNGRRIQLFDAAGNAYSYVITEFYRLKDTGVSLEQRITNARFMEPTGDQRLTLITCWPPTNNTHRLIVIAAPAQ